MLCSRESFCLLEEVNAHSGIAACGAFYFAKVH